MRIQLTLDSNQDDDGYLRGFIKYAFMEYTFVPEAKVSVGLMPYPWAAYIYNNVWPYLMMERGFFSYWNVYSTADFGASFLGSALNDHVFYQSAVFNGEGFKTPETEKHKEYVALAGVKLGNPDSVNGSLAGQYSYQSADEGVIKSVASGGGVLNIWKVKLGGEYQYATKTMHEGNFPEVDPKKYPEGFFAALKAKEGASKLLSEDQDVHYGGYAGYLVVSLHEKLDLVGRYDFYDPNFSSKYKNDGVSMWMSGLVFKLPAGVQAGIDYREYDFQAKNLDDDHNREMVPERVIYSHWKIPF